MHLTLSATACVNPAAGCANQPTICFYALLDAVVDWYFNAIEKIGDKVETLKMEIINQPRKESLVELYNIKREVIYPRKQVWPLRDMINNLFGPNREFITPTHSAFFRDLLDHSTRIIDTNKLTATCSAAWWIFTSATTPIKMNEVMKVLTIMSSVFIPVTFIAGVYGMNFNFICLNLITLRLCRSMVNAQCYGWFTVLFQKEKWI